MSELQPFRYCLRVRYGECDGQGVVYNPRYGEYIDLAATEFLRAIFAPENCFNGNFEFQVVKMLVEWTAPARFDDVLEIECALAKLGTTSFTLGFAIRKRGESGTIVTAETVNVHVNGKTWTKQAIPNDVRARLTKAARGQTCEHSGR